MRGERYQIALIALGVLVTLIFGAFFYREFFPEYKNYQNRYTALEKFRSGYTGNPPPPFQYGVKQIVFESPERGAAKIDRCTSCHVAMKFEHFSPTKLARDINGNLILDDKGVPVKVPNDDYVWAKLDKKIKELEKTNPTEADKLRSLKTVTVDGHQFNAEIALQMHPLMGRETRPFEYHDMNEYGCTSCHSGNGRGLTAQKAHGPVFDGQYETEYMGPKPVFTESDPKNDPQFARIFNHKPGHELLFQTSPILAGNLVQSQCVQCHLSSQGILETTANETLYLSKLREEKSEAVQKAFDHEKLALVSLLSLIREMHREGYEKTLEHLKSKASDYTLSAKERKFARAQSNYLKKINPKQGLHDLEERVLQIVGSEKLGNLIAKRIVQKNGDPEKLVDSFIQHFKGKSEAKGPLFLKYQALQENNAQLELVLGTSAIMEKAASDPKIAKAFNTQIDRLTHTYHEGKELYISQACYACHRVDGVARGGIGPDLTQIGEYYPWYIKEAMVWPQANLKTSQMPNYKMDHEELEELMTYLLSLRGRPKSVSESAYKEKISAWEEGEKMPIEEAINPGKLHDLRYGMTIFGTEGCASCHRLKGFESNVGFAIEKGKPDWNALYKERQWFQNLIPEFIIGSELTKVLEKHGEEIDRKIVSGVRQGSILEEIEKSYPGVIETYYTDFKYANRAKNNALQGDDLAKWKDRVHRVLMVFIQEYGYGRVVGPRLNWSGVYRSDEWLIRHFRKPNALVARSLMPVFPFDDSKFYALTYMLDLLGERNRNELREIWRHKGFDPQLAYQKLCAQCHGAYLQGNGPVSDWIYPVPKNLRNADFLRNLTKERVMQSIVDGIKGGPMPPWGEAPKDKPNYDGVPVLTHVEAKQLVDWIFSSLLGGSVIRGSEDVPKWQYTPKDVIKELEDEGNVLKSGSVPSIIDFDEVPSNTGASLFPEVERYYASLDPKPYPEKETKVTELFEVVPSHGSGPEKDHYYIKKKYYTEENILAGQRFFEENCAVCHGKEADGQGFRAGTMFDAKPRMLINLDWVDSRDDLRLLRSIKYGVPGTAMTPWGDQTSSLQRLQLVIYIRSLNLEQNHRDALFDALYNTFDVADQIIDRARIQEFQKINDLQEKLDRLTLQSLSFVNEENALKSYKQELSLAAELNENKEVDHILVDLKKEVHREGVLYRDFGGQLLNKTLFGDILNKYLEMINLNQGIYSVEDGILKADFDPDKEKKIQEMGRELSDRFKKRKDEAEKKERIEKGKMNSPQRSRSLERFTAEIKGYEKLQEDIDSTFSEIKRSRKRQQKLVKTYEERIKKLHQPQEKE